MRFGKVVPYPVALGFLALAFAIRISLAPFFEGEVPYPIFPIAVLLAAWYCGVGPAVVTAVAGYAGNEFLSDAPFKDFLLTASLSAALSGTIIFFVAKFRHERDMATQADMKLRQSEAVLTQSAARLKESEHRLRATFNNAAVGITEADVHARIVAVNERMCRMLGYTREEILGMTVHEITAPEDRALSEAMSGKLRAGESDRNDYDKRYVRKDGSLFWAHVTASCVRDEAGRFLYAIATLEDISERKRAEKALRDSEQNYRTLADSTSALIWASGSDKLCNYFNQTWLRFTGRTLEQESGDGWTQGVHPEDVAHCMAIYTEAFERRAPFSVEYRLRRHDGEYRWVRDDGCPRYDSQGHFIGYLGYVMDITEAKQSADAIAASERRYRQTLDTMLEGCMIIGFDWNFIYVNEAAARNGRKNRANLIGRNLLALYPGIERSEIFANWRRAMDVRLPQRFDSSYTFPDGNVAWYEFFVQPVPEGIFILSLDISERKRAEDALREASLSAGQARAVAEEASRAKDRFLAVLSHELRTPLTPVLAAVQLLQRDPHLNEELRHPLDIMRRNIQLEAQLIDDLLDLTRIVQGKLVLNRKPVTIATVIERAVEIAKPDISARKLHFAVDMEDPSLLVNGDGSRLQQVIWNLLSNAVKFTPEGGCVGVRCRREDARVSIEVTDSGIGIERDALERIFDAFEQGGHAITRQFGGLGLGLAIAKRLVEMHEGSISAHSEGRSKGSVFRVLLPLTSAVEIEEAKKTARAVPGTGRRILLVEDNGDTAAMMKMLLEAFGYEIETAGDVAQALRAVESRGFDLLISDLGLPDQSGIELMQELRRRGSQLKGIALSGYGREEDVQRSKEAGFSAHVTKPVDAEVLVETVSGFL